MIERKYSVREIILMRRAVQLSFPDGISFSSRERAVEVEEQLRTYMEAGVEPEELRAEVDQIEGSMANTPSC